MNSTSKTGDLFTVEPRAFETGEYNWIDTRIIQISPTRLWSLGWEGQPTFNMDLQFNYDSDVDILEPTEGTTIGVVKKVGLDDWIVVPSTLARSEEAIIVEDVDSFSDYALAIVEEEASSDQSPSRTVIVSSIVISPNPIKDLSRLTYELKEPGNVTIHLVNPAGQSVKQVFAGYQAKGRQEVTIDVNDLLPGAYYCSIQANGQPHGVAIQKQ